MKCSSALLAGLAWLVSCSNNIERPPEVAVQGSSVKVNYLGQSNSYGNFPSPREMLSEARNIL